MVKPRSTRTPIPQGVGVATALLSTYPPGCTCYVTVKDNRCHLVWHAGCPAHPNTPPTVPGQQPQLAPAWLACPNTPPCPHPGLLHDIAELDDPQPVCCADGCPCGQPPTPGEDT